VSLRFRVADLQRELNALNAIAQSYMARNSKEALGELADQLVRIHKGGLPGSWEIPDDQPLETIVSEGAYQKGGGVHHLWARISMIWDLRPVDDYLIEVVDRATTHVVLVSNEFLGAVHMDIGDPNAPGCFFHAQVHNHGQGGPTAPFPRSLDVPRFPTLLATPASVVEFILSELFQKDWRDHVARHAQRGLWLGTQKKWWERHLDWQQRAIADAGFSPWLELKEALPETELFC